MVERLVSKNFVGKMELFEAVNFRVRREAHPR